MPLRKSYIGAKQRSISKLILLVLLIQLTLPGAVWVESYLNVPSVRQIVGFIYLTFLPGLFIGKIIGLHRLDKVEFILYVVGLSVSTVMFLGLLANIVYPLVGIVNPISFVNLLVLINIYITILAILSFLKAESKSFPVKVQVRNLLFISLPLLAVVSAVMVNLVANNKPMILLIFLIIIVFIIIAFFDHKGTTHLAFVYGSALALLYHRSLISVNLTGWDIHLEYYYCKLTLLNSFWDYTIRYTYNAMLSDTILPAIYSLILGISPTWVFKIVYPIIFALVPVALYRVYQRGFDNRTACIATFFFIATSMYYGVMISLAKQQIAEFFFSLLLLLIVSRDTEKLKRAILIIIFSAALVMSHYGISYFYLMFYILPIAIFFVFLRYFRKFESSTISISLTYLFIYFVMCLAWYMYIAQSVTFVNVIKLGEHITTNIGEIFSPQTRDVEVLKALGLKQTLSPLHDFSRVFYWVTNFFIFVGVLDLFHGIITGKVSWRKLTPEFSLMSFISMLLIFLCIVLPYFSTTLHVERIYHILLIILSPFCVTGGDMVSKQLLYVYSYFTNMEPKDLVNFLTFVLLSVLVPYFLFNTGLIYELTNDQAPTSISLSLDDMRSSDKLDVKLMFRSQYIFEEEISSVKWISARRASNIIICGDYFSHWYILPHGMIFPSRILENDLLFREAYIYLNQLNTADKIMVAPTGLPAQPLCTYNISSISKLLDSKIYSNDNSEIYYYMPQ